MTSNREVFYRDPATTTIPNLGVAQVKEPEDKKDWETVEWELRSFVCEGAYQTGMEKIIGSFLSHLNEPQQPGVWVSGFYGSGKSHLVRVLEFLWRDLKLPSGETARGVTDLPQEVSDQLVELASAGKRAGGLWSAAGHLGAGTPDAIRLAFLSIVLASAGLPPRFGAGKLAIYLRQEGHEDVVQQRLEAAGRDYEHELKNLYVSPHLAEALIEASPTFGESTADVGGRLQEQFPDKTSITNDELLDTVGEVLRLQSSKEDELPLTLIVLDEMQQFIGEDRKRALEVQHIAEGCAARFESRLLLVATGQAALSATPTLQKLNDRFPVDVALKDTDVEAVVRQVILRKKSDKTKELEGVLAEVSGEIDRHLRGTKIEAIAEDKQDLVADYPLLPTRRRFWERALRAIDKAGKAGVLRTQLKIVHEAAKEVADQPLGTVVGGDFIYAQQSSGMLATNVLLKEIDELIRGMDAEGGEGPLKARICSLIFLISELPKEGIGTTGLRATAPFIADLLIQDLGEDGARLRKRVPEILDELVEDGSVMQADGEFKLQTKVGADWTKDFEARRSAISDDPARMSQLRSQWLQKATDEALGGSKLAQGQSKTSRKFSVEWDEPSAPYDDVPVWIRDGWSVPEADFGHEALAAGDDDPVVRVFLPQLEAQAIRDAMASWQAATETVEQRPAPQNDEGRSAKRGIESRGNAAEDRLTDLFGEVVGAAEVMLGGGAEVAADSTRERVHAGVKSALARLYPKFPQADNPNWAKVLAQAREGAPDALKHVGHSGEVLTHPVCKEIFSAIGGAGTKGADIQKEYEASPYGWPRDAINAAIVVLLVGGHIRAERDGQPAGPKELPATQLGKATFYKEDDPPPMEETIAVRGLLAEAAVDYEAGSEGAAIGSLIQRLKDLAERAGGNPPLPEPPDMGLVGEVQALAGNQQVRFVAKREKDLKAALVAWGKASESREAREAEWAMLERLLRHAGGLEGIEAVVRARDAIEGERQLLSDPDPVAPLVDDVAKLLRAALKARFKELSETTERTLSELETTEDWTSLDEKDRHEILAEVGLSPFEAPETSTNESLLGLLDRTPLARWEDQLELLQTRADKARVLAAKMHEPKTVSLRPETATIKSKEDLDDYVAGVRELVTPHLEADETVIL